MGRCGCPSGDGSSGDPGSPPWLPSRLAPTKTSPRTVEGLGESPWSACARGVGEWLEQSGVLLSFFSFLFPVSLFFLFMNYV
jgi:hypothetical protein